MDQNELNKLLSKLKLGDVRYFESLGSTNDEALAWATSGAADMSLIVADEQTMGRGRYDRPWFTPPGTALAFSLIVHPTRGERPHLSRLVGLAALSIARSIQARGLYPEIKWPNDVLLNRRKVAGVLIELVWSGEDVENVVIGVGVNISKRSVPSTDILRFPAISLDDLLDQPIDRVEILYEILATFISLRPKLGTDELIKEWEKLLAYQNRQVQVDLGGGQMVTGKVAGLEPDGSLDIRDENGKLITVRFGDVRLRPYA
jgi:BirA family transcriptional regulator, biotin operon repressor / biotin---[acetyl-CoA-carboxylase] ligase